MIFWIMLVIFVASLIWGIKSNQYERISQIIISVISGVIVVFMVIIIFVFNVGIQGDIATNNARYEMLTYQYQNNFYDNDNDIGKKELINQIQDWNEDLAFGKAMQHDFWIGIFIPDIFDRFEPIALDEPSK